MDGSWELGPALNQARLSAQLLDFACQHKGKLVSQYFNYVNSFNFIFFINLLNSIILLKIKNKNKIEGLAAQPNSPRGLNQPWMTEGQAGSSVPMATTSYLGVTPPISLWDLAVPKVHQWSSQVPGTTRYLTCKSLFHSSFVHLCDEQITIRKG